MNAPTPVTAAATYDGRLRVADIVTSHPECASVFCRHGIDVCDQGRQTLDEACAGRGLDAAGVLQDLVDAVRRRAEDPPDDDPRPLSMASLVARIVDRHHGWLRRSLPWIRDLAAKVGVVHGASDPRTIELAAVVARLHDALLPHLDDEERRLFPALLAPRGGRRAPVEAALRSMEAEHREVGALLDRVRALTSDYAPPAWACRAYRALLAELEHLEGDVLRCVQLEGQVLAPRARGQRSG